VPDSYCVLVLADRGLYARWLFKRIVRLGWHPALRINGSGTFRVHGQPHYEALGSVLRGEVFQGRCRLACTLGVYAAKGCGEAWLVLTDLAPQQWSACCYGLRAWIEHGFKLTKREGWQWQRSRIQEPQRAARQWLVLAMATLRVVMTGSHVEDKAAPASSARQHRPRQVSLFRRG
jgi:Transposase DDE domain